MSVRVVTPALVPAAFAKRSISVPMLEKKPVHAFFILKAGVETFTGSYFNLVELSFSHGINIKFSFRKKERKKPQNIRVKSRSSLF